MIFLAFIPEPLRASPRPKGVGELSDGEDASVAECLSLLYCHFRQQTKVVALNRTSSASIPEFAFTAMPVQHEIR